MEKETLKRLQDLGVDWTNWYADEMKDPYDIVCGSMGCRAWMRPKQAPKKEENAGVRKNKSIAALGTYKRLLREKGRDWMSKNHPDVLEQLDNTPPTTKGDYK